MSHPSKLIVRFLALTLLSFLSCPGIVPAQNTNAAPAPSVPVEKANPAGLSPFGIGGDAHTGRDLTPWMPKMADIGIHVMRCCYADQRD